MTTNRRPFFLDLRVIALPVGGWVSILHRASGAALALAAPVLLWLLMLSLASPAGYERARTFLAGGIGALFALAVAWATLHHLLAGLRHLGFDVGLGEARLAARRSAWAVLALAVAGTAGLALRWWP
ncbi:succinate dehydrogenase, cytochrome b556 subunit [Parasulfuritortus cantonensis]|uniref:Succinate dehydrogenase cytochrome b556 subunit n=1 Tax=Parasulfuritortus cantonensis TaxID=2528202 RepID=A0A4R1B4J2_9PROT|nr:succinate dehydrogenase, cytochrome b556 subunit [Parasulfuritortus cantonensis]TCJ13022.1 succinate dehydrogenase, cytochrome b556 subunit [Parasulfuritortus cantonensis]